MPVLSLMGYAVPGAFLAGGLKRQDKDRSRALWWAVWLCLLLYLLLLVVYFLVWGIRYFQRHTRPPQ